MMRALLLACLAAAISGCTIALPIGATAPPTASQPPVPLKVGIHYEQSFLDYHYKSSGWGRDTFIFPLGPASTKLFDATIGQHFIETERIAQWPLPAEARPDLEAAFAVRLVEFVDEYPRRSFVTLATRVEYVVEMADAHGRPLEEWRVSGTGYGGVKSKGIYQICSREGEDCRVGRLPGSTPFMGTGGTPIDVLILPLIIGSLAYDLSSESFPPWKYALAGVVDLAMNSAAQEFSAELRRNERIQSWIAEQTAN